VIEHMMKKSKDHHLRLAIAMLRKCALSNKAVEMLLGDGAYIWFFLSHVMEESGCVKQCLLVAMIYLQRALQNAKSSMSPRRIQAMIVASIMLSSKWLEDSTVQPEDWAWISGFTKSTLVRAERKILALLHWKIYVNREEYESAFACGD